MATVSVKSARVKPTHARAVKPASAPVRRAPKSLTPILQHALAVAGRHAAGDSRDRLKPGAYEVNTTVQIVGTLTVGRDKDVETKVAPSAQDMLGMVLELVPSDDRAALLERLIHRASQDGGHVDPRNVHCFGQARMIVELFTRTVPTPRRGSVTGKFSVTTAAS